MADIKISNIGSLCAPLGQYSHVTRVKASEYIFIAGQVGARNDGTFAEGFDAQCAQAFENTRLALEGCGADRKSVV